MKKKLVMALGLVAALFAFSTDAKAERLAYVPGVLVVETRQAPVYYHPRQQQHNNWKQHYRQQAQYGQQIQWNNNQWNNNHNHRRYKQEQCRNDDRSYRNYNQTRYYYYR